MFMILIRSIRISLIDESNISTPAIQRQVPDENQNIVLRGR